MCLYKNIFCLAERSIHDSYLCLSSFSCLFFHYAKNLEGWGLTMNTTKIHTYPGQQFIRMVLELWSQPLLCGLQCGSRAICSSGRDLGTEVTATAHSLAGIGTSNPILLLAARPRYPPSVLLSLHGSSVRGRIWITILREASFSSRAWEVLSCWCWILLTAGIVLQILLMNSIFDKHIDAVVFIRLPDEIFSLPFSSLNKCTYLEYPHMQLQVTYLLILVKSTQQELHRCIPNSLGKASRSLSCDTKRVSYSSMRTPAKQIPISQVENIAITKPTLLPASWKRSVGKITLIASQPKVVRSYGFSNKRVAFLAIALFPSPSPPHMLTSAN